MTANEREVVAIIDELRSQANEVNRSGMARYGINTERAFGMSIPPLRAMGKLLGRNHDRALTLWESGWHEARLLAVFTDEPSKVTEAQMDAWALDFNSWDITDQCCSNLFIHTPYAVEKVRQWAVREEEFVRRAAFAMLAALAVHSRTLVDGDFRTLLPLIAAAAEDERNFVKKAVNWALRQIGKRNLALHADAIALAEELAQRASRSSRWIARDALRELHNQGTIERIQVKEAKHRKENTGKRTPPRASNA
ncbi:MAG: DNA alkylation repair protein [Bacteroidetes bacterium]|nr:DNA alkylation repair protein [Bacteroidota bacterium]